MGVVCTVMVEVCSSGNGGGLVIMVAVRVVVMEGVVIHEVV